MPEPRIVQLLRSGAALSQIQGLAAKLWLAAGGADPDGRLAAAVDAYWKSQPGADPYWQALSERMNCAACGETYRLENTSICPNCFKTYCYKHERTCVCGHATLG